MNFSYICRVDRCNITSAGGRTYILSCQKFFATPYFDLSREQQALIEHAQHQITLVDFPDSLDVIKGQDLDVSLLQEQDVFDPELGGMQARFAKGFMKGELSIHALAGKSGLRHFAEVADIALQSEHLYLQFSIDFSFASSADNRHLKRPVTYDTFLDGVPVFSSGLPGIGLVRNLVD